MQRVRITRADIEAFGTTAGCPGCNVIRSGKRAQAHSDKNAESEPTFQKYMGRVVLRGDVVKNDSGSYAASTEQGFISFTVTAALATDVIAGLPDCDGQAADAESVFFWRVSVVFWRATERQKKKVLATTPASQNGFPLKKWFSTPKKCRLQSFEGWGARRVGARRVRSPKGRSPNPEKVGARKVGAANGGSQKNGGGAPISRFSFVPPQMSFFLPSLSGRSSFEAVAHPKCAFGLLWGLCVRAPAAHARQRKTDTRPKKTQP